MFAKEPFEGVAVDPASEDVLRTGEASTFDKQNLNSLTGKCQRSCATRWPSTDDDYFESSKRQLKSTKGLPGLFILALVFLGFADPATLQNLLDEFDCSLDLPLQCHWIVANGRFCF